MPIKNETRILRIDSSARKQDSISRKLGDEVIRRLKRAHPAAVLIKRDVSAGLGFIDELWVEMRTQYSYGGSWLFGEFSIADCMFAPVVFRFNTYGVSLSEHSEEYKETVLSHPNVIQWLNQAEGEKEIIDYAEVGG